MKMFKKKTVKKRDVRRRNEFSSFLSWTLDEELEAVLKEAGIFNDAQEVIECLKESPRYKVNLCSAAEAKLEAKRKEVEEAEKAVKAACYCGGK